MKRLNSYLLTHYPLLWNLRVHLIWPVIIVLHALFFAWGYAVARFPGTLRYHRFRPTEDVLAFAILLSVLAGVGWLALYFRNNALKSFLPLKRGRTVAEFLLVFLTFIGLSAAGVSYTLANAWHVRQMSVGIDIQSESETIALAEHFLPFVPQSFSRFNNCDGTEGQYGSVLDSSGGHVDTFSYLHYCDSRYVLVDPQTDSHAYVASAETQRARRWLRNGNADSVRQVLKQYLRLVKKYRGSYFFNPDAHVTSIFSRPGFPLQYTLYSDYVSSSDTNREHSTFDDDIIEPTIVASDESGLIVLQEENLKYGSRYAYIEQYHPEAALQAIAEARNGPIDDDHLLILLYSALAMSMLVLGFRLTDLRVWFMALIGAGLWLAVIGLMAAVISTERGVLILVLVLEIGFTLMALRAIIGGWRRRWAGMLYLWSYAGMPFVLPLLWHLLDIMTRPPLLYNRDGSSYNPPAPFNEFLDNNRDVCHMGNLILMCLVVILVYIPLARRWQAMPEE